MLPRSGLGLARMNKLVEVYEQTKHSLPSLFRLHEILQREGISELEIINLLKLANNNELHYLQDKVEYCRHQLNIMELQKTKATSDILILNTRIDGLREIVNSCELYLNEKRDQIASLNNELRRLDHFANTSYDNRDDQDSNVEIFYATGDWK